MINEVLYCERLLYLEWAQGEFEDNVFTVEGRSVHRRADVAGGELPPPPAGAAPGAAEGHAGTTPSPVPGMPPASPMQPAAPEAARRGSARRALRDDDAAEPPPYEARSVWLSSERLGITARIDVVEGDASGRLLPIEYKRGHAPDVPGGAYLPERAQLCAHVLLLREHGYACDEAAIYFAASRRRVPIAIDEALVAATLAAAARAREVTGAACIPPPLVDSPKCNGCSLVGICLPDETNLLRRLAGEELDAPAEGLLAGVEAVEQGPDELEGPLEVDPWGLAGEASEASEASAASEVSAASEASAAAKPGEGDAAGETELRRLHPARDDRLPVYVQEQGARIGLAGERLVVHTRAGGRSEARLSNTSQVALLGNVQISTQAMRALLERGIPLCFMTYGGYYLGRATGLDSRNVELRVAQHRAAADEAFCLSFARGVVVSKIKNARTMLRRNHAAAEPAVLSELDQLARKAAEAPSLASLLGLEGTAARAYFGAFPGMLKGPDEVRGAFDLEGRNRRPPRDPVNALLSLAYALLAKDLAVTLGTVGLDPLLGFYHQPRFGRPALALDLMEEFRPIVADSVVVATINNGVVAPDDFQRHGDAVALRPAGRKKFLMAYERRMDQLVTHPVFGYRISYRRVLEVQARLLARVLLGEVEAYPSFRTR
ncbi:CRISPR-associated protein Cas4 [Sorangium cellulosum]|uniref:CRISPR-associated endonuclease Cas1 n=1 Tax=Sorangium cellulosum TaxID=56 RepID=A0A4P2PTK8_SORCE|nr:CRISPR-associated endonuclease Cas1 [Sorangium cellulosum]AUX19870.1 CRISPR-associated protein Cas4 [Sorangium cellulosum]